MVFKKDYTKKLIKQYTEKKTPIASFGDDALILPNHSGVSNHRELANYTKFSSLSASSPLSYDGAGAFSFLFNTNNTWTGTNTYSSTHTHSSTVNNNGEINGSLHTYVFTTDTIKFTSTATQYPYVNGAGIQFGTSKGFVVPENGCVAKIGLDWDLVNNTSSLLFLGMTIVTPDGSTNITLDESAGTGKKYSTTWARSTSGARSFDAGDRIYIAVSPFTIGSFDVDMNNLVITLTLYFDS